MFSAEMNDDIFDNSTHYLIYNKNFLYNSIEPIIYLYKNIINMNENIKKAISKNKTSKFLFTEEGTKYQISRNKLIPVFNGSQIEEPGDESDTKIMDENIMEKLEEFKKTKLNDINSTIKKFYNAKLIDIDNINDVKFGLSNFCSFVSINLHLCPSMKVDDKDELMEDILNLIIN